MNFASTFRSLFLGVAFAIAAVTASADTRQGGADIVDTAVAAGSFKTLVTAIQAAGLVDTLKGAGPFTVLHRLMKLLPNCRPVRWTPC